jgi:hypothetical protein
MSGARRWMQAGLAGLGLMGLVACADVSSDPEQKTRLDELVITDPNFDFATARAIRLDLRAPDGSTPRGIEVSDAEGRRLMSGGLRGSATLDLRVSVGQADRLKVRVGEGDDVTEHELVVDENNHAGMDL